MLKLQGKTAFVFGVASEDSIAWAICEQLAAAGVTLYLGYQKRFMSRIFQLKDKLPQIGGFYPLDVAEDADGKGEDDGGRHQLQVVVVNVLETKVAAKVRAEGDAAGTVGVGVLEPGPKEPQLSAAPLPPGAAVPFGLELQRQFVDEV